MSTAKMIFTYKRKRLSSCSSAGLACPDLSSDVRTGKHQNVTDERSEKPRKDIKIFKCINRDDVDLSMNCNSYIQPYNPQNVESRHKHVCQGGKFSSSCSSPQVHRSSIPKESGHVEGSDTISTREPVLSSHELAGDDTSKTLSLSAVASLVNAANSSQRGSCLDLNSSSPHEDGCIQGGSVSPAAEKDTDSLPKQSLPSNSEVGKAKLTTPLLTFSRRLKRKADTGNQDMNRKLLIREGTTAVKDNKPMCASSYSCEVTSNKSRQGEGSVDLAVASGDVNMRDVFCQGKEETISKEIGDCPSSCTRSNADIVIFRHTKGGVRSGEDLAADSSANAKQTVTNTANFSKENVECSSSIGNAVSDGDHTCKTNKQPVSNQLQRASSGDSQLTSSDGSDSKTVAGKTAEQKASSSSLDFSGLPPGGFVIDCNVIPESDLEEQASDIIHHPLGMAKNRGNLMQEGHLKSKSLELFQDTGVEAEDSRLVQSSKDACTSVEAESKHNNKWLQLFPTDDGKSCPFPPADTRSEIYCSKAEENSTLALDGRKDWHEQSSRRASAILGLSMPTEPIVGQTSKHGSHMQPFQQPSFISREFTQNPMAPPFPDHSSYTFRHKLLLETINTKATALRGNRNISLDKFEPCPIVWSEEELDSLWIGIRRHGRGNWHAMLLDPRLRFAPWRTARDLADQWEREQCKLLSGQPMPQGRYSNLPQPCNLDCNGGFSCPRVTGIMRESVSAETQLSLGDVYAQKEGSSCYRSTAQSYGIIPPDNKHLRMASGGLFNNLQNNVVVRGDGSPDGLAIGLAMNNNNWLRDPFGPFSRSSEAAMPSVSALSQMGAPRIVHPFAEPSGTSCGPRNPPRGFHYGRPSMRKRVVNDNVIVIDSSDASSEETVSDDHNVRR